MKLKRLIVHGFKSFKDRTTIEFDDGITGIVGPNGCGKSNIVDALFWVMGAQSAKHLRGNSMKDVIFAGSSKYSPGAWAEVSLVLENDGGKHIHIGQKVACPSEIQITRKLYRNSETEYRINGEPCRLKDIHEVFMDTGAGAKSYSIIAQGEINRLVQAKPEERRVMIEQVAGVTKFKTRKKESLKKIEQTQSNLSRLQDLQREIEKNLSSLKKQAEKAEKARTLKEKVKRNDLVVNSHKVFDLLKDLRDGNLSLNENRIDLENWNIRKDSLEVDLQEERIKKDEVTENIESLQKMFNEESKILAGNEQKLNYLKKSIEEKNEQIESRQLEIEETSEDTSERKEKLASITLERDRIKENAEQGFDFSELEELVENLKENLDLKEEEISNSREEFENKKNSLQEVEQNLFKYTSKLEEFAGNLEDITEEIEVTEKQFSGVSSEISDERDLVNELELKVSSLSEKETELKEIVASAKQVLEENTTKLASLNKDFITNESKLNSLIEVNKSLEGAKEGTNEFLANNSTEEFDILGSLVKCDEKYTQAVQALLRSTLDVIVNKNSNYRSVKDWVVENNEKGIEFFSNNFELIENQESLERLKLNLGEDLISLKDVISIEDEYKASILPILDGLYICESLDIDKVSNLPNTSYQAITSLNGEIVIRRSAGGSVISSGKIQNPAQGIIDRNNKISELEVVVSELKIELEKLQEVVNTQDEIFNSKKEELDELREILSDTKADFAARKSAYESKVSNLETGNTRLEILKNRKSEISKQRLEYLEKEDELNKEKSFLFEIVEELSEKLSASQEDLISIREQYEGNREELLNKQVEAKSFQEKVNAFESQIEDINSQIEKQNIKIENMSEMVSEYREEIFNMNEESRELEELNNEKATELREKEVELNSIKDSLGALLAGMQQREDEVKELNSKINKTEKEIVEKEVKLSQHLIDEEQIVKDIFEKYRVDLRSVIGKFLEYEESDFERLNNIDSIFEMETEFGPERITKEFYEFHRRYGQDLKDCQVKLRNYKNEYNRLGEINWQAIEDYDRQKIRFEFLSEQEEELKQSLTDLEMAISQIDEKSKARFKLAFEEVNTRFEKVFPIIFGGGNAKLQVTGDLDDPECGVDIIAQPPGKKMQNINLMSGGEKAMTAVSLIFSIFLVKPSPFCLLDEVDAPLDDANVGRFNELLREMSSESQFILITHNKKTMELNDTLYGVTMQEPGISKAVSVQLH